MNLVAVSSVTRSEMRIGDWVVAIGNPSGLGRFPSPPASSRRGRASIRALDNLHPTMPPSIEAIPAARCSTWCEVVGINGYLSPTGGSVGSVLRSDIDSPRGWEERGLAGKAIIAHCANSAETRRGWLWCSDPGMSMRKHGGALGLESPRGEPCFAGLDPEGPANAAGHRTAT